MKAGGPGIRLVGPRGKVCVPGEKAKRLIAAGTHVFADKRSKAKWERYLAGEGKYARPEPEEVVGGDGGGENPPPLPPTGGEGEGGGGGGSTEQTPVASPGTTSVGASEPVSGRSPKVAPKTSKKRAAKKS